MDTDDTTHQPPGEHTLNPYICVQGAARAIDWYRDVLGATERGDRFVDPEGRVGHAEIVIGDSVLMLADPHPDIGVVAPDPGDAASTYSLYVHVPDVDAVVAAGDRAGATVERPPEDAFHGSRLGTLRDPFGVRWMVSTRQRQVPAGEMREAAERYGREGTTDG